MDKQSMVEEYRATIYRIIGSNELAENEIIRIIIEKINKLSIIFEQNGINPDFMDEYIDGNISMLKLQTRRMCDIRKEDILMQFDAIVRKIQNQLNETDGKENEEQRRIEQGNIDEMTLIETDNILYARRIANELLDNLLDIRSHANRVLDYKEFPFSKIQDILEDMRVYVNQIEVESEEEIFGALEEDKKNIIEILTSEYEETLKVMEMIEKTKENEEENFRDHLDAGISLERQSEFARKWSEKEETEREEKKPSLGEGINLI